MALGKEVDERLDGSLDMELNTWLKEEYWYRWFDEVFPPTAEDEIEENPSSNILSASQHSEDLPWIDNLPSHSDQFSESICNEIAMLTKKIDSMSSSSYLLGFHLCRRGACYRKSGELKNALDDLNRAIELEPRLLDAYWHRHLVYLIQVRF